MKATKIKYFIIYIFSLYYTVSDGQNLHKYMYNNHNKKYSEIQKELRGKPGIMEKWGEKDIQKFNRFARYWDSRLDSSGDFSKMIKNLDKFYLAQYPDNKTETITETSFVTSLGTGGYTWEQVGLTERPSGAFEQTGRGMVRSIWVDPDDTLTILIGASSGGLWKTTDGGVNWNCLTDNYIMGGVTDIAVNPDDKNEIHVSTRMGGRVSLAPSGDYSMGVFVTYNGGASWERLTNGLTLEEGYQRIWRDPNNPYNLIVMSKKSVYKSTSRGHTWTRLNFNHPGLMELEELNCLLVHPDNHNIIYISGANSFYRSSDGGNTWLNLGQPAYVPQLFSNYNLYICIDPNDPDEYYINYWDRDGFPVCTPNRVAHSTNGTGFTIINSQNTICSYGSEFIAVSPNGKIFAGGYRMNRSDNGGGLFVRKSSGELHPDIRDICFPDPTNGDVVYLATDGGVYKSTDAGEQWVRINGNLSTNEFYDLAIYEPDREIMLSGSHDCGTYYRKSNGEWYHLHGGDGGRSMIDYSNPNTAYATSTGGLHRHEAITRFPSTLIGSFTYDAPVYMHQANPSTIYKAFYQSVEISTNKGGNWTETDYTNLHLRDFAMCKYRPDYLYYISYIDWGGPEDIYIRKYNGNTWGTMTYNGLGGLITSTPLNDIWVNPCDPDHVIIIFGGFNIDQNVFQFNKANNRWDNISGSGLPINLPVHCYERFGDIEFAGTDVGLYSRSDGVNWQWCDGLPRCIISDIKINNLYGDAVVSTYGRGIYRTKLLLEGCYTGSTVYVSSAQTISALKTICSNYTINNGGNLTISSQVVFANEATIIVKSGGVLNINGGVVINVNINVESGGRLNVTNDGRIVLNSYDNLVINTGAIYEAAEGKVTVRYTH